MENRNGILGLELWKWYSVNVIKLNYKLQAVREQFSDLDLGGENAGQQEDNNNGGTPGTPDYNGIGSFSLAEMLEVIPSWFSWISFVKSYCHKYITIWLFMWHKC